MATSTPIPAISFQNDLPYDVTIYDSFTPSTETDAEKTYFGQLTPLGSVAAKSTGSVTPKRTSSAFIIDNTTGNKPVKRCTKMAFQTTLTSFTVSQADEDAMTATLGFIDFFLRNPDDALSKSFQAILNGNPKTWLSGMNAFFAKQPSYAACTFQTYMMGMAYVALNPESTTKPVEEATYSLSKLVVLLGGKWPEGMTDISVSDFTCTNKDEVVDIWVDIDISNLPFESDAIKKNVNSMFSDKKLKANLQFNYGLGIGIFGTRLSILLDTIQIPISSSTTFAITQPGITIDISPVFKFVVFTMKATFPFNINGKNFDAIASFVIDNEEAAISVDIQGDKTSLPAPPGIKGLHFDEFGVGMGLFFEPPGFALGVQGKFHIGDPVDLAMADALLALAQQNLNYADPLRMSDPAAYQNAQMAYQAALDWDVQLRALIYTPNISDDTFALVCEYVEEVIKPKYVAFYVPKLSLVEVIALFTNASPAITVPVNFTDLSFHWSDGLMDAVVLPDGTLSSGGYGFSAIVNIFSFGFYGEVEIDINNGVTALVEMSPLHLGDVFNLSGDGKGVTIKVDGNGNPIKNNFVPTTQAEKNAIQNATDKQVVTAGGPSLIINTLTQPILHLNAKVSLFEVMDYGIEADINSEGIKFQLNFGGVLTGQMTCRLSDFHNFYGGFKFAINRGFTLPAIAGVSLGSIHVEALADAHLSITTSLSDIVLTIGGSFDFEARTRQFGDFSADIHIQKITDVIEAVITNLAGYAGEIFKDMVQDAGIWLDKAKRGLITGYTAVSDVLKNGFNKSADEVASLMKGAGYAADEVASEIKNTFNLSVDAVESAMKSAGYAADEVIAALKNIFSINEIASAFKNVYGLSVNDINSFLQSAGYTADQVKSAFESLGGEFADFAKNAWDKITNPDTWNPSKW